MNKPQQANRALHVKITEDQHSKIEKLAELYQCSKSDIFRSSLDTFVRSNKLEHLVGDGIFDRMCQATGLVLTGEMSLEERLLSTIYRLQNIYSRTVAEATKSRSPNKRRNPRYRAINV